MQLTEECFEIIFCRIPWPLCSRKKVSQKAVLSLSSVIPALSIDSR